MGRLRKTEPTSAIKYFIAFGTLAFIILAVSTLWILKKASKEFGPANQNLSILSRLKYAYLLNKNSEVLNESVVFPDGLEQKFFIDPSESVSQICQKLQSEKFVTDSQAICQLLIYSGRDRTMQPGSYTIPSGMNAKDIANRIGSAEYRDRDLRVFSGWRIEEIANAIDLLGLSFTGDTLLDTIQKEYPVLRERYRFLNTNSLEGFILPGLYPLKPEITLDETISLFLDKFETEVIDIGLDKQIESHGLSLSEGLTMASIIQRETLAVEEMPTMASVFYNRLSLGMKLQTDVTVQYAIGWHAPQNTWWKSSLTWDDLAITSPYNTYEVFGLPPGPICSPGISAIQAVATPEQTNFLFFRAACDQSGRHNFAITYEEHLSNGCE